MKHLISFVKSNIGLTVGVGGIIGSLVVLVILAEFAVIDASSFMAMSFWAIVLFLCLGITMMVIERIDNARN